MSSPRVSVTTRAAEPAPPTEYVLAMDEETARMLLDLTGEVVGSGPVRAHVNAVYDALADHFPGDYLKTSSFDGNIRTRE